MNKFIITKALFLLSTLQFFERIVFYGTLTLLLMYTTKFFNFSTENAYSFWGLFLGLAYTLPFLGGLLADKYIGFIDATLWGFYCLGLGCFVLSLNGGVVVFYLGVSIQLVGFGLFKSNIGNLVGFLYEGNAQIKDRTYTFFSMAMAMGAILGPIIFGLCVKYSGWHLGFALSAGMILIAGFYFQFSSKRIEFVGMLKKPHISFVGRAFLIMVLLLIMFFVFLLLKISEVANSLLGVSSVVLFFILVIRAMRCTKKDRRKILGLVILIMCTIIWYAASLQIDGSLLMLIQKYLKHTLFGWDIPVTFFSSLEGFFGLAVGPIMIWFWTYLANRKRDWRVSTKVAVGMCFAFLCFLCFAFTIVTAKLWLVPLLFVVFGSAFLGISDMFEIPIIMSAVSRYAPNTLIGTMMGLVMMRNAISGYIGSYIGRLTLGSGSTVQLMHYFYVFVSVAFACLIIAFMLFIYRRGLTHLLEGKSSSK